MVLITRQGLHSNSSPSNRGLFIFTQICRLLAHSYVRPAESAAANMVFLGWGEDKYNYMAKHCNGAAQSRLASAGFRGSYRRSGFYVCV